MKKKKMALGGMRVKFHDLRGAVMTNAPYNAERFALLNNRSLYNVINNRNTHIAYSKYKSKSKLQLLL